MPAAKVVLSLGSNQGDSQQLIGAALKELATAGPARGLELVAHSPFYATPPWGGVEQPDFLNVTAICECSLPPLELLRWCQELEHQGGRVRTLRWGPRTLDIDIISYGAIESADPTLTLPHPRAAERLFVLVPWLAVDPQAQLGEASVAELIAGFDPQERAQIRPVADPATW